MLKRLFICQGMTKTSNQEFIIFIFLLLLFLLLLLLLLFIFIIFHLAVLIDVNFFVYTLPLSKLYVKKKKKRLKNVNQGNHIGKYQIF